MRYIIYIYVPLFSCLVVQPGEYFILGTYCFMYIVMFELGG